MLRTRLGAIRVAGEGPAPESETGRGLVIVIALAGRWGIDPRRPFGKIVWSHFPTTPPATTIRVVQEAGTC